jgi:hypothetical protein
VYGSIDPEMSHSRTSRRGSIRRWRRASLIGSPPVRRLARSVRRMSMCSPWRPFLVRRIFRFGVASWSFAIIL